MKHQSLRGTVLSAAAVLLLFCSCSPRISAVIKSPEEIRTTVNCTLPSVLTDVMVSLTGSSAQELISTAAITDNLRLNGIPTQSCTIDASSTFSLTTGTLTATTLPLPVETGKNRITITFSPQAMQHIVSLLPEETAGTFDLLMAPVLTGESMDSEDYAGLIGAVYGSPVATELENSRLTLELQTPAPATLTILKNGSVTTVTSKTTTLQHQFSLLQMLILQEPVQLTISW